jgi:transposase
MGVRPRVSKQELEIRRRAAVSLRKQGFTVREVAKVIGCVPSSVVRWEQLFDDDGATGLDAKP